jgi:hypothetical protein
MLYRVSEFGRFHMTRHATEGGVGGTPSDLEIGILEHNPGQVH